MESYDNGKTTATYIIKTYQMWSVKSVSSLIFILTHSFECERKKDTCFRQLAKTFTQTCEDKKKKRLE